MYLRKIPDSLHNRIIIFLLLLMHRLAANLGVISCSKANAKCGLVTFPTCSIELNFACYSQDHQNISFVQHPFIGNFYTLNQMIIDRFIDKNLKNYGRANKLTTRTYVDMNIFLVLIQSSAPKVRNLNIC